VTAHGDLPRGKPSVVILTGLNQSGKSTLLEELVRFLKENDLKVAGIIAKGLWQGNIRSGFDLLDLTGGSVMPLSRRTSDGGLVQGIPFVFFEESLASGLRALSPDRCAGADVVIVDEVGFLELQGFGWSGALEPLLDMDGPVQVWVVRCNCIEPVRHKWGLADAETITVGEPDALERLQKACLMSGERGAGNGERGVRSEE
jgi:nucleoside-triphosphatase THEP1